MAAMMLMTINFNTGFLRPHHFFTARLFLSRYYTLIRTTTADPCFICILLFNLIPEDKIIAKVLWCLQ